MAQLAHGLYTAGAHLAARLYAWTMCRRGRWDADAIAQRMGRELPPASLAQPVWLHAASMGEVRVGALGAHALTARGAAILGSAMTETGFRLVSDIYPAGTIAIRAPFDLPAAVDTVLDRYHPRSLVLVETELWPNMIRRCAQRGIPVFVINGRLSDKAFPWYRRTRFYWRAILNDVCGFFMRSAEDAGRLRSLGVDDSRIHVAGSLKAAVVPVTSAKSMALIERIRQVDQPVWIAGSTRPGEEEIILAAHQRLRGQFPALQLWIAPRHPERFDEVASLCARAQLPTVRWTELSAVDTASSLAILLVDQMGILPELYALADASFVGGSLVPLGGHNPLEPALVGTPVLVGPHTDNQRESVEQLLADGLAQVVTDVDGLVGSLTSLLSVPVTAGQRAERAARAKGAGGRIVETIADEILSHSPRTPKGSSR